tara:strand:- start:158 stop:349 length:192 start_codon:yes stop_codon:yes gene_type:complete
MRKLPRKGSFRSTQMEKIPVSAPVVCSGVRVRNRAGVRARVRLGARARLRLRAGVGVRVGGWG